MIDQLVAVLDSPRPTRSYVPECCYNPETNNLGRVQRHIVAYLGTVPAGFSRGAHWSASGELEWHGPPFGATVAEITTAVYGDTTATQVRATQRAVRRLQDLGLVDCWHGSLRTCSYTTPRGFTGERTVPGLYVALKWICPHIAKDTCMENGATK